MSQYKKSLPNVALRVAQAALTFLSFNPGRVELRDRSTDSVLRRQPTSKRRLTADGALDAATESKLLAEAFSA